MSATEKAKFFFRTLPRLLSCLALATACTPAPAAEYLVKGTKGGYMAVELATIDPIVSASGSIGRFTHGRVRGIDGVADFDYYIGVYGCSTGSKFVWVMDVDRPPEQAVKHSWFNDSNSLISLVAKAVCSAPTKRSV